MIARVGVVATLPIVAGPRADVVDAVGRRGTVMRGDAPGSRGVLRRDGTPGWRVAGEQ